MVDSIKEPGAFLTPRLNHGINMAFMKIGAQKLILLGALNDRTPKYPEDAFYANPMRKITDKEYMGLDACRHIIIDLTILYCNAIPIIFVFLTENYLPAH